MSTLHGIKALADGVRAQFLANSSPVIVPPVGWDQRNQQQNYSAVPGGGRVIFMPGQYDGSAGAPKPIDGGEFSRDLKFQSLNPRENVGWDSWVTCSVWAVDPTRMMQEEDQILATLDLVESTLQAINMATHTSADGSIQTVGQANIKFNGKTTWVLPPSTVTTFGREFVFSFVQRCRWLNAAYGIAYPQPEVSRTPAL
jgi:hypothetical protein